jgi:hypothetical protein
VGILNVIDARDPGSISVIGEKDLRRQIDRSVSRALVDGDYATRLLSDPTVVLEDRGCPPQYYRWLRSIEAVSLSDFARQALGHFWAAESSTMSAAHEEHAPRTASAVR